MATALTIADRGGSVLILEKEPTIGGNSQKASSGINAAPPTTAPPTDTNVDIEDSTDLFYQDTVTSAGPTLARPELIARFVQDSAAALDWLQTRVGMDLSGTTQLGGHSARRTHRPASATTIGRDLVQGLQQALQEYSTDNSNMDQSSNSPSPQHQHQQPKGKVTIWTRCQVTNLLWQQQQEDESSQDSGRVIGVECIRDEASNDDKDNTSDKPHQEKTATPQRLYCNHVIVATGGFAGGPSSSFLSQHRPDLKDWPTTAGAFSTGDGLTLGMAVGGYCVDMDQVQIHPTAFVDPAHPQARSKILAAELLRGVGGLLLNADGRRFCNELGTRQYIVQQQFKEYSHNHPHNHDNNKIPDHTTSSSSLSTTTGTLPSPFYLVLTEAAAQEAPTHVKFYTFKGLLTKVQGLQALADYLQLPSVSTLQQTSVEYQEAAAAAESTGPSSTPTVQDPFGKTVFRGVPTVRPNNDQHNDSLTFYVGQVTPALHYCMGGLAMDAQGRVLRRRQQQQQQRSSTDQVDKPNSNSHEDSEWIPGFYAVGEVTGGVHGANRLAGNSLLECTVFGRLVGQSIPIPNAADPSTQEVRS